MLMSIVWQQNRVKQTKVVFLVSKFFRWMEISAFVKCYAENFVVIMFYIICCLCLDFNPTTSVCYGVWLHLLFAVTYMEPWYKMDI